MRYLIEGALKADGSEVMKTIEAATEADARLIAAAEGILVASVEAGPDPLEELAEQAIHAEPIQLPKPTIPPDISPVVTAEAARLRLAGSVIGILAWIELGAGIIGGVAAVCVGDPLLSLELIFAGIISCAICQGIAGLLRMTGLIGLMVRDASRKP